MSNQQFSKKNKGHRLIKIKSISQKKSECLESNQSPSLLEAERKFLIEQEIEAAQIELKKLQEEKERMISSVIAKIKLEQEQWEDEKKILIETAQQEGIAKGFEEGKKTGFKQYLTKIEKLNKLVDTTTRDYHKTLEQSEQMIVDLSIRTAEKIINEKINDDQKHYLSIVKNAIQEIKDQSIVSIYSHPDNYEFLVKQKDELKNIVDGDTKISIFIDQKMNKNDCLIEHPFGKIDASIDTQLNQIRDALYQVEMEKKT